MDCDPSLDAPRRDTPLNMGFWGGCDAQSVQRLLTVDDDAAQRYAGLVSGTTPANRQILALGNSDTYGGGGGAYEGGEPSSIHHTLLTERQLRDQHACGGSSPTAAGSKRFSSRNGRWPANAPASAGAPR